MAKTILLSVPVDEELDQALKQGARRESRPVASFIRHTSQLKLQEMGILDEDFHLVTEDEPA